MYREEEDDICERKKMDEMRKVVSERLMYLRDERDCIEGDSVARVPVGRMILEDWKFFERESCPAR